MIDPLQTAIFELTRTGWDIDVIGKPNRLGQITIGFKSPRLTHRALMVLSPGQPPEEAFHQAEAEELAYLAHDSTINAVLDGVKADILRNLSTLYRLAGAGKVVEIPTEVILKEVVIPLSVTERAPNARTFGTEEADLS